MSQSVRVAMVQDNFHVGDINANAQLIIQRTRTAAENRARLVVFPELALVGYPPEDLLYRPGFIAQVEQAVTTIKLAVSGIDIVIGLPLALNGKLYNSAIWLRDGQCIAHYHKQSLPNYSVFDEVRYFSPGNETCVVSLNEVRFGLVICEDAWEDGPVAYAKKAGADAIIVLNASPFHGGKYRERVQVLQQRSRENDLPMFYVNMVGGQDELVFDGESLVVDRTGAVIRRSAAFQAAIELIDLTETGPVAITSGATQALEQEEAIYQALVLGVRDFVTKNGFSSVVIGLSGGVDSALTLAIAVDALGADNVHAVMMPSRYTSIISREDAEAEAVLLGVRYDVIAIEAAFEAFLDSLSGVFSGTQPDTTEENIQARCRGLILMAISNKTGRMLLTTGNKSEMAVGYATLYGDMCGGFAPIKDVYKTMVYRLCHYRNSLGRVIPERVLTREPSAELRDNQVDQDSLPAYEILDRILELSVEQDIPIDDVVNAGFDRDTVEHVLALVQRNEYKRRQSAPGVRVTRRAFGRDRRYPITSGYRRK
ncbi:MAG: NAD+ synthase [Gammaproteobacteria bacterium]|nr:NAD+ synthase [Gammaproteobacteria bacterium]NNJ98159.1 NAD+ synthase [Gammaproteobacteria bacterium]